MCGIFGAIGKNANPGIIRALALINRDRGTDSIGFFDSLGKDIKIATDPLLALGRTDISVYIESACRKGWFIAGHTRHATTGARTTPNAHPFRYGRIIGSHNGMVRFPKDRNYKVDSEYLFDQLNRHNNDYQAALADVDGYWGLTWTDGNAFYISTHDNSLYVVRAADGVWYYSSDDEHLAACVGRSGDLVKISNGDTIRFDANADSYTVLPNFRSVVVKTDYGFDRSKTGGSKGRKKSKTTFWTTTPIVPKGSEATGLPAGLKIPSALQNPVRPNAASDPVELDEEDVLAVTKALGHAEWDYLNELAIGNGYSSGEDFMRAENFSSESAALAFLEDCAYVELHEKAREDEVTAWEEYSGREDSERVREQRDFDSYADWIDKQ